jgi:uncharacterized delta-60 repeat protein
MVDRLRSWLSRSFHPRPDRVAGRAPGRPCIASARPELEALEDRTLPSTGGIVLLFSSVPAVGSAPPGTGSAQLTQPDGKVLVAGPASNASGNLVNVLERFNSDGTLDAGFGAGGEVSTTISADASEEIGLSVQADGKILLAVDPPGANTVTVARFDPDGSVDNTFAPGGQVSLSLVPVPGTSSTREAEGDGVIVVLDSGGVHIQSDPALLYKTDSLGTYSLGVANGADSLTSVSISMSTTPNQSGYAVTYGSQTTQIPWMQQPGLSGYAVNDGSRTTQIPWMQQTDLRLPVSNATMMGSGSLSFPASNLTIRESDSRLTWVGSAPLAQGPAISPVTLDFRPPGVDSSALVQAPLLWLQGSDARADGGNSSMVAQAPAAATTPNASAMLPTYLGAAPSVPVVTLVLLSGPGTPSPAVPVSTASADGLPAYLNLPVTGTSVSNGPDGDELAPSLSAEVHDAGLAAVDAAFALAASGVKRDPLADGIEEDFLPADSADRHSQRPRSVSWPLWLVLLVAASSGGAAWQGSGRMVGLAGDRPRPDEPPGN